MWMHISPNINKTMCVYNAIDCPSTKFMFVGSTIFFIYIFIDYGIKTAPTPTVKVFFSLCSLMYFSKCSKNAGSSLFGP